MKNKLKYPIKIDDGSIINNLKDEKLFFSEREKMIRENFYKGSTIDECHVNESSSKCCYGIEII